MAGDQAIGPEGVEGLEIVIVAYVAGGLPLFNSVLNLAQAQFDFLTNLVRWIIFHLF